jgi:hypothetical protein
VNEVVSYFKQLGRGHQILPFVIAGTPNAGNGHQPGATGVDECYVPALRHPVKSDGTLDPARLASKHAFVDARYGAEKREILGQDHRSAAAELERAKIQLIALLLGVGFDLLWSRQQKFHFLELMEAQEQARETLNQVADVRQQLHEAQNQAREIQRQALEQQNLPRAVQEQIQEAQTQAGDGAATGAGRAGTTSGSSKSSPGDASAVGGSARSGACGQKQGVGSAASGARIPEPA